MSKLHILCIDDDIQIRYALGQLCESQGWQAELAKDVGEGLNIFSTKPIDLVVIDYHLPNVSGVEGVRMLRKRSATVPIIVFTIDDNQEVADAFLQAGANDFALKPIKALDMISRIKLHIRLMESDRNRMYGESGCKGISNATAKLILHFLEQTPEDVTVLQIADGTGLASQTVHRYLQYLVSEKLVVAENSYGKVGRPKQYFHLAGSGAQL